MKKKLANSISVALHPVFIPTYMLLFMVLLEHYAVHPHLPFQWLLLVGVVLFSTVIVPMLMLFVLKKQGEISDYYIERAQQRNIPYAVMILLYTFCAWLSMKLDFRFYAMFASACSFASIELYLINKFWKISAHMCGIGGLCGIVFAYSWLFALNFSWFYCAILLLAGFVAWARLALNAHTLAQIVVGFIVGLLNGLLPLWLF